MLIFMNLLGINFKKVNKHQQVETKRGKKYLFFFGNFIEIGQEIFFFSNCNFILFLYFSFFFVVLEIGSNFKKYLRGSDLSDLEEDRAHLFLEKRGETLTVATLREYLREIDLDNNHRVAFLEYALWRYKKGVLDFFKELATPKAGGGAALQAAIDAYRKILAVREAREAKMEALAEAAKAGGVKGNTALQELKIMQSEDELAARKAEITAGAAKRKAEKNSADPFEEEQKRLEAEKQQKVNKRK